MKAVARCSRRRVGALFALVSVALVPAAAAEEVEWVVYTGRWGIQKAGTSSELGFEVHRPFRRTGFDLVGGLTATVDEAVWAYAGASWSWQPNGKWRLRPGFAVSVFESGDGKDLGGPIQFRSSLEASYRLRRDLRLGLLVYHLSNAGIYDLNPGSNSLVFVVGSAVP
ncbi:MAG: acyloxyacyl hydrolase [Acidobacteria bacterium]|nr:acyloxyacyl hydrolase [Acidobacteriota bacterium]